jgi:hypothetical protein
MDRQSQKGAATLPRSAKRAVLGRTSAVTMCGLHFPSPPAQSTPCTPSRRAALCTRVFRRWGGCPALRVWGPQSIRPWMGPV